MEVSTLKPGALFSPGHVRHCHSRTRAARASTSAAVSHLSDCPLTELTVPAGTMLGQLLNPQEGKPIQCRSPCQPR